MADKIVKITEDEKEFEDDNEVVEKTPEEEKRPQRRAPQRGPQSKGASSRQPYDADGRRGQGGARRGGYFQGRRRVCPIKFEEVDWKNLDSLRYFVSDDGSLRPRRKTGANAKLQRKVAVMVKRARYMALLPYTGEHVRLAHKR